MTTSLFGNATSVVNANVFNTISALRAINSLTSTSAKVLGYYATGDGGGGDYYLDPADHASTDNGGTIIVSADGGRWKLATYSMISLRQFGAKGDGVTNDTTAVQAAINYGAACYAPKGNYLISGRTGIIYKSGTYVFGEGKSDTLFISDGTGASTIELAGYNLGSLFRRQWAVAGPNTYVSDVNLRDFSVILTHPLAAVTTTAIQIGIDLRNTTRSNIERVHVGNNTPSSSSYQRTFTGNYEVQGYGIVGGNVSSGLVGIYAGGEVNRIVNCSVWGAYKLIVNDDATLSPSSSAHALAVHNCDLQGGQHLLVQESTSTTAMSWFNNTLQNVKQQPGNGGSSYVTHIEGYNNTFRDGYIEASNAATYMCFFGAASHNNDFKFTYYSATNLPTFTDTGTNNSISMMENTGSIPGGLDSFGRTFILYNKVYKNVWVQFHWDTANVIIDDSAGVSGIVRNGVGDYTITFKKPYASAIYGVCNALNSDVSADSGSVNVRAQGTNSVRVVTYKQAAGVTTQIDPVSVWVGTNT